MLKNDSKTISNVAAIDSQSNIASIGKPFITSYSWPTNNGFERQIPVPLK